MGWVESIKRALRRGDGDAARLAIAARIEAGETLNLDEISADTGLKPAALRRIADSLIAEDIRRRVDRGVATAWVPTDAIYQRATTLGMEQAAAKAAIGNAISDHFTALVQEILADGMIDPEEDQRVDRFMAMVGQSTLAAETARMLEEGREMYRASTAELVAVDAPVLLKKGEFCVYAVGAEALEERSRTVKVGYHGPSARIRIAKGIYYNAGSMAVSRQTDIFEHSFGIGVLCVTNKRLLWISAQKSISTPLNNVVRYDPYSDGMRIMKGTGKPLLFMWAEKPRVATIYASRAIEELRD
jgi:hypothetical protein